MEVLEGIDKKNPPPSPPGAFSNISTFNIAFAIALIDNFVCLDFLLESSRSNPVSLLKPVKGVF
jgi:hypothetical protein